MPTPPASRRARPRRARSMSQRPPAPQTPSTTAPSPWDTDLLAQVGPHGLAVALIEAMRLQPTVKSFVLSRRDAETILMVARVSPDTLATVQEDVIALMRRSKRDASTAPPT